MNRHGVASKNLRNYDVNGLGELTGMVNIGIARFSARKKMTRCVRSSKSSFRYIYERKRFNVGWINKITL